jgi:hypothetical protein
MRYIFPAAFALAAAVVASAFVFAMTGCPPPMQPAIPDATDATPPSIVIDASPPAPPSEASIDAGCSAGKCCAVCANLDRAGCAQPSCVWACLATTQFHVLNLDCLVDAGSLAAIRSCGVQCTPKP